MKPKPLNFNFESLYDFFPYEEVEKLMLKISKEGHSFPHYTTCKTCEADFEEVVRFTFKYVKQRIKSACEFYLRYENDPKLLVKEHYHLLKKMEDDDIWAFTLLLTAPDLEIKINEYNKWLFKLAFRDVFDGDIEGGR